jgi:nicotinate-nucleotide pyrophosphorylase (carboxylating)
MISGLKVAAMAFKLVNRAIKFTPRIQDGDIVKKGALIAAISGNARAILAGERVALNFLSLLSGISTKTLAYVNAVKPFKTRILDTRKTIPGLRLLEKYAVRAAGGYNHRMSLNEMIMVKDNHLKIMPGLNRLDRLPAKYKVEVEVENLAQFLLALNLHPDIIMLDNMPVRDMKKAVRIRDRLLHRRPQLEASGGITMNNVKKVASTGVDAISIGELTHSVDSVDLSLEVI